MRIRVEDIPLEGRELKFNLSKTEINERIAADQLVRQGSELEGPPYTFLADPQVRLYLLPEGSTVVVTGEVNGEYSTLCSRCAEEAIAKLSTPIELILKPQSERDGEDEDLHFGVYKDDEIECAGFAEELFVLSLPFTVLCKEKCKGLCAQCGKNLNQGPCECKSVEGGDPRLSVLRSLKIH